METENPFTTGSNWMGGRAEEIHSPDPAASKNLCPFSLPFISHTATRSTLRKQKSDHVIYLLKSLWWHYTTSLGYSATWHGMRGLHSIWLVPKVQASSPLTHFSVWPALTHLHGIPIPRTSVPITGLWGMLLVVPLPEPGPTPFELILHNPALMFLKGNFPTCPKYLFILSYVSRAWLYISIFTCIILH